MRSVHLGDPATLSALFLGELWRGRSNIRVSLRVPLTRDTAPSIAAPVVTLGALASLAIGGFSWKFGGWWIACAGAAWIVVLTSVRALAMALRAPADERGVRLTSQAWLVAGVYDIARALALVVRSGHEVRRRT
jgi:hypothetical protein